MKFLIKHAQPILKARQATALDANQIATIQLSARREAMPWLSEVHSDQEVQVYFSQLLDSQECWVAEIEGEVVGFSVLKDGWLNHLYVAPKFQNLGAGSKLLEIAKTRSPASLELWAFQGNLRAREFYAKKGFIEVEWTDGSSNEEQTPDVRLIWRTSGLGKDEAKVS